MLKNNTFTEETLFYALRKEYGESQRTFAKNLGISLVAYFHLEKGNTFPNFEVIDKCMECYNVNFEAFRNYYHRRKKFIETKLA